MAEKILITGATGNVASLVIPSLKSEGAELSALVHNPDKAQDLKNFGVEVFVGEYDKPETLAPALEGASTVFLAIPAHERASQWASGAIAAAKQAGGPRIVRLSALKADPDGPTDNTRQHGHTDLELKSSGLPYSILRPHFFMQNVLMAAQSILSDGVMYWGMGDGKLGMIDVRDIADVAVNVLLDGSHNSETYELTGPATVSFHDVAASLSAAVGREVKYVPVTIEAIEDSIRGAGWGEWAATVFGQYHKAFSEGWGDYTTDAVKAITGQAPRSFENFAKEVFAPAFAAME
ncbi:MAG: SDR family oxidoreductase [Nitrospiraceae bacterium]